MSQTGTVQDNEVENWFRVTTKAQYLDRCADVWFGEDDGQSIATSDGQIRGKFAGRELSGTWEWHDEFFCRTSMLGDLDLGHDCIVIEITETKMRLTMERGAGPSVVYDRKDGPLVDADADELITILSTFEIKPEGIDTFTAAMIDNQDQVRSEPGNLEMRMFQSASNPGAFFVFGRTDGQASMEAHSAEVDDRGIESQVAGTLQAPPVTMNLKETDPASDPLTRTVTVRDGALTVIGIFTLKPGYRDQVLEKYATQVPLCRADEANILFEVYALQDDDNQLVVIERWTDQPAALDFSTTRPHSIETGALLQEAVDGDLADQLHVVSEIAPY